MSDKTKKKIWWPDVSMPKSKKISPAVQAALHAILKSGPFKVYASRGFTGFARPRLHIYGPPQLSPQTFRRLKNAEFVRQLMEDDLKSIWDISGAGIEALRLADSEIAAIGSQFQERRLETPL